MNDKLCAYCKIISSLLRTCTTLNTEEDFYFYMYVCLMCKLSQVLCYRKYVYPSLRFYRPWKLNVAHARELDPVLSATRRYHVTLIRANPSRGLSFSSALGNCILNAPVIPVCYPHLRCSCSRLSRIGSWNMTAP